MVPTHGLVVDMCAGIGVLSHAALTRDTYNNNINKIICLERDSRYIEIGKNLLKATKIQNEIEAKYGKIDCIISNPAYSVVTKTDKTGLVKIQRK